MTTLLHNYIKYNQLPLHQHSYPRGKYTVHVSSLHQLHRLFLTPPPLRLPPSLLVTQVFIRIQDSNDNPPVFSQAAYDVSVSEDVPVDMELLRVRATDVDERARLSFTIYASVDPASMRLFRVNPGTGVVYTADRLDYEARTQHILTIMVGGRSITRVCLLMCVCPCGVVQVMNLLATPPAKLNFSWFPSFIASCKHHPYSSLIFPDAAVGQGSGISI